MQARIREQSTEVIPLPLTPLHTPLQEEFISTIKAQNPRTAEAFLRTFISLEKAINKDAVNATEDDIFVYVRNLKKESGCDYHRKRLQQFYSFCYEATKEPRYSRIVLALGNKLLLRFFKKEKGAPVKRTQDSIYCLRVLSRIRTCKMSKCHWREKCMGGEIEVKHTRGSPVPAILKTVPSTEIATTEEESKNIWVTAPCLGCECDNPASCKKLEEWAIEKYDKNLAGQVSV